MTFYASSFVYNSIPSETYNLHISEIGSSGSSTMMGSSNMNIYNQKLYRRSVPYFYGSTTGDNLKFEVEITSPEDIDSETSQLIQKWLFSNKQYKKLLIVQPDMENSYFNGIFNNPQIIRVGNVIQGYTATFECDAPFAWKYPKTVQYTYTGSVINSTVTFNNASDDKGSYLYPSLAIKMNSSGGSVTITNTSDANRVSSFTGLSANEIITIDSSLQTISSSTGLKRLSNFNKKFLRLIPNLNSLRFQGNISYIYMTYQFVAKL